MFTPSSSAEIRSLVDGILDRLGASNIFRDGDVVARSPITGAGYGTLARALSADEAADRSADVFTSWRDVPAPRRGDMVRRLGDLLRVHLDDVATLVQIEAGKIRSEAIGEVREMIDVCDFAVGLSRQLHGLSIASERPLHRLTETWHPLGPIAVITAFNFPVAVWSWNAALALVCGDPVVWKPSDHSAITALACNTLARRAAVECDLDPDVCQVVFGGADVGRDLAVDARFPLVSATGSTRMGRELAPVVASRFGRSILELGGNNAAIVTPSADLDMAVRAITFAAAGTAGQRCTSLRRLVVHESVASELSERVERAFAGLRVGNPLHDDPLVGPLISVDARRRMSAALDTARADGGSVVGGERMFESEAPEASFMRPAVVRMPAQTEIVCTETFAPVLYVMTYDDFDEAIALQNGVPQGLASSIFTTDLREAERFTGPSGSDCGIANVNIGPSGAEIGGAFGGEKETGGGRESGSDSWKAYMRRSTATVNYSNELPLAQGVVFE